VKRKLIIVLVLISVAAVWSTSAMSDDAPKMTKDELKAMLGNPDLTIIDVRTSTDWTGSDMKITGAVREDPGEVNAWAGKYPKDKPIVLYCA
jgi:rhodanese-related sulfurtransferase